MHHPTLTSPATGRFLDSPKRASVLFRTRPTPCRWLAVSLVAAGGVATAQEALRNARQMEPVSVARAPSPESQGYTVKAGDFRMLASTSLGLDWNDNISISSGNSSAVGGAKDDFILRPTLDLNGSYPLTQKNLLSLQLGLGYDKYFNHSELDRWRLTSGSGLSFDMLAGDFRFNFHDRVSYSQNSALEPAVANTAAYGSLNNTAGLLTVWDLADVVASLGYDHQNVFSSSSGFSSQDRAVEMLVGRVGLKVQPTLTTGVETSGSSTAYDQRTLNDSLGYSAGVYADWQPGRAFHVQPRAGYSWNSFSQTSERLQATDQGAMYFDLTAAHQFTDAMSYSLSVGRETRAGVQSDLIEDWYVRPTFNWHVTRNLSASANLSYEHGSQGGGALPGSVPENYDYWGGGLSLSRPLTKRLTASLNYRITTRSSTAGGRDYTQNVVGLLFNYSFQ